MSVLNEEIIVSSIKMVLGKLDIYMQKNELWLLYYLKINLKWNEDLNVRSETILVLSENIGEKLPDIGLGNEFLTITPKAQGVKPKINKWDYGKQKNKNAA